MISLALKNIWHRRKRYAWLFIELIAVTFISWYVIDRLVVLTYQYNEPLGYDRDRLCVVKIGLDINSDAPQSINISGLEPDHLNILRQIRDMPQVESATPINWIFDKMAEPSHRIVAPDSSQYNVYSVPFIRGQDFFKTFGITAGAGEDGVDYLSNAESGINYVVITRSLANILYPGKNPMTASDSMYMASLLDNPNAQPWQRPNKVLGVVDDVKPNSTLSGNFGVEFKPEEQSGMDNATWDIAVRLKPDVNVKAFVTEIKSNLDELQSGKLMAYGVRSYDDISEEFQNRESGPARRLDMIFAFFFLFNVCLGVTGTFWMMTRKRSEEVGVLRAYGSSRSGILGLLISEAVILTLVAWLVGCALWLYYALGAGLFMGDIQNGGLAKSWVEIFPLHFAIISGIILVLLIIAVLIGVAGPGYKLSRVEPVDALRDE